MDQNSHQSTSSLNMRKRAQSLGGDALETLKQQQKSKRQRASSVGFGELSPGKIKRRTLAPRRSILKAVGATFEDPDTLNFTNPLHAYTTDLSSLSTAPFSTNNKQPADARRRSSSAPAGSAPNDDSDEDEDDGEMDMDITRMEETRDYTMNEDRRKSLARRVSFAPNAHIRTFTPEKPTAAAQRLMKERASVGGASPSDSSFDSYNASFSSNEDASFQSNANEEDGQTQEMDLAEPAGVTMAFANHFAGTVDPKVFEEEEDENAMGPGADPEEDEDDESEGEEMELAHTTDFTNAFGSHPVVFRPGAAAVEGEEEAPNGVSQQQKPKQPRFSVMVRTEDEEDEEVMRELQAQAAAAKAVTQEKPKPRFSQVAREEDDEDAAVLKELGIQKGKGFIGAQAIQDEEEDSEDDEEDDGEPMDLTGVTNVAAPNSDHEEQEDEDENADMDMEEATGTMAMQEATTYGGILATATSVFAPPPDRRLSALRASTGPRPSLGSPRRVFRPTSASDSVALAPIPVSAPAPAPVEPTPAPVSAPEAESIPAAAPKSPSLSPQRRISLTKPTPKPTTPTRTRERSRSRSLSPTKTRTPSRATRSPGGSLSLKGLMMASASKSQAELVFAPPSSLARSPRKSSTAAFVMPPIAVSPRRSPRRSIAPSPKKSVETAPGEDNTGSSFGYVDEEAPKQIASLEEFFEETGTGFMKDVLGMTGVNLGEGRRKSIALRQEVDREPSGPPTFADLCVAGAYTALMHQLYHNESQFLQEGLQEGFNRLKLFDEAIQNEEPRLFAEWSRATEAHRAVMMGQFRMIKSHYYLTGKIEWNEMRNINYEQIIGALEGTLEGLQTDKAVIAETKFKDVLPALHERRAALIRELQDERSRDVELESCDKEQLEELHDAIEEQSEQLQIHERQHAESVGRLTDLQAKAKELEEQEAAMAKERDALLQVLEEGRCFTKTEVSRLQGEYDALQKLHGWTLTHFTATSVQLCHLGEFDVTLSLDGASVKSTTLKLAKPTKNDLSGELTRFLFAKLVELVEGAASGQGKIRPHLMLSHIASLWTNARRLRRELCVTALRFPISTRLSKSSLYASAEVFIPLTMSSFNIVFGLTGEELADREDHRPVELEKVVGRMGCEVLVRFGNVDAQSLKYIIGERLDVGGRGAVLQACNETEAAAGKV
ncbi:chromosome segregation protein [Pseudohyphozyma bogoriensis]|nr:chromosome segregation protein [Pseudohyphozyma bogoriensis]